MGGIPLEHVRVKALFLFSFTWEAEAGGGSECNLGLSTVQRSVCDVGTKQKRGVPTSGIFLQL